MPHDWIIEVLDDLRTYARENRLEKLATEIGELRLVALTEIASTEGSTNAANDATLLLEQAIQCPPCKTR